MRTALPKQSHQLDQAHQIASRRYRAAYMAEWDERYACLLGGCPKRSLAVRSHADVEHSGYGG